MAETTDIEKKSLQAHVELCASRYRFLEEKLRSVEAAVAESNATIIEVRDMMQNMAHQRNSQIMSWGTSLIALLLGIIGFLISRFVFS